MLQIKEAEKIIFLSENSAKNQIRIAPINFNENVEQIKKRLITYKGIIEQAINQL